MPLHLDGETPGMWVDESLEGRPATHALVIGVSDYPHLRGGRSETAPDHFGLGQLAVSALTAYRFFEWLRDEYNYETAQIGSVHLLLAPNVEELTTTRGMVGAFGPAVFDTCELALNKWRQRLSGLGATAAESRSVFFFSGHGLEISQQQQILLPGDYLNPDLPSVNRAMSTLNIKQGLLPLDVVDQFFFIDACRNGSRQLGGRVVEGSAIFDVFPPDENNGSVNSVIMYGTSSGAQSWQPARVGEGISLYGQALLEAVGGGAPVDEAEDPPLVWFTDVATYTNQQISNLLRQRGAQVRQPIRGDLGFVGLVHPLVRSSSPTPVRNVWATAPGEPEDVEDEATVSHGMTGQAVAGVAFRDLVPGVYLDPASGWQHFDSEASPHEWFGRETFEAVWATARVVDVRSGEDVSIQVHGVDRYEAASHRVRLSVDGYGPMWLTIDAPNDTYGGFLWATPGTLFELGMDWEEEALVQLDIDLSTHSEEPLRASARLWEEYRTSDIDAASSRLIESGDLERAVGAVQAKTAAPASPLSAIVASLVLLHSGQWRSMPPSWAENMCNLPVFADLPDGAVIWAEVLKRLGRNAPVPVEVACARLADRELMPLTGDAVSFALALTEILTETLSPTNPNRASVDSFADRLHAIAPHLHAGGLFLTLAGSQSQIDRSLVLNR